MVMRDHISVSFPFQVLKADCRFPTIQLSLKRNSPPKMRLKFMAAASIAVPQEIVDAIEGVGFLASIPLWLVSLLGSLFITVRSGRPVR